MGPKQVLPLQVRVDQKLMVMKRYYKDPRSSELDLQSGEAAEYIDCLFAEGGGGSYLLQWVSWIWH